MKYCQCHNILSLKQGLLGLKEEVREFIEKPSMDELSDIIYCVNRIAGTITRRPYLKLIPGDKLHVIKIKNRMISYGCIRSKRHLKFGECPSLKPKRIKAIIGNTFIFGH